MKTDIVRIQLPSDDGAEHPFRSSICKILLDSIKQRFGDVPITQTTWLIRVQDMPANKPTFSVLDPQQALYTQLRYQTVIEFPTIYVFNKVPTIWDGYEITIQKNVVENSSTDQKTRSHDEHGNGVDNDDIATDAKILPLTDV
ncbi:hypothetical protein H4S06_001144 [Coemansia sp. BCRC 34490]|nr:hypothetical protein H4S06_001144 [Coemansia sp. BCRC 34490]